MSPVKSGRTLTAINHALAMATVIYAASYWFKDNLKVKGLSGAFTAALAMGFIGLRNVIFCLKPNGDNQFNG